MIKALFTSATGLKGQQLYVDTIANNLANVNTTGFKRSQVQFQDLLYEEIVTPGMEIAQGFQSPEGLQVGSGVRAVGTSKIFTQGPLENTGRALDLAIEGAGFFQIMRPDGSAAYTRDGSFALDSRRRLVTAGGLLVSPQVTIPTDAVEISIARDGTVNVLSSGNPPQLSSVGQLTLVKFPNAAGLESLGQNLYGETPASGTPTTATPGQDGTGEIVQQFLERSNVAVVTELVNLIVAQRAYEINSRAIRTSDEMLGMTNQLTR